MTRLHLEADELLTTTRAVRRRLDLERPVQAALIRECVEIALQAPSGGNTQGWQFVAVFDAGKRAALAELYRRGWALYKKAPGSVFDLEQQERDPARREQLQRVARSADYLVEQLHRVPVHVIPCIPGRVEKMGGPMASVALASVYGSILPAAWSYMLAARERGLGTCWTTVHLMHEREAAELLGIPYETHTQVALIPTAWTLGTGFRPSLRKPVDAVLHIDGW
ncbi:MAG: nitroreductase family protein [Gammaproteobacteria bacterium]|nr:nitroreductase family protein [Gammaproteobacteria bacterium]